MYYSKGKKDKVTTQIPKQTAIETSKALVRQFGNKKKAAYQCLSLLGSEVLYKWCPNNVIEIIFGYMATNNSVKSFFNSLAAQIN